MEVSGEIHDPDALPPGKISRAHWKGNWVGPRAGQYFLEKGLLVQEGLKSSIVQSIA
jgi:hypothetical protein